MKNTLKKKRGTGKKSGPQLARLIQEERALSKRLEKLQGRISKLHSNMQPSRSLKAIDRWLEELNEGSSNGHSLPADWSRADLYDDHD